MIHTPDHSLGQHWLHDPASLQQMCDVAEVEATDTVLEIGPGLGTLTSYLAARAGRVVAVEFDSELARRLSGQAAANVEVVQGDILHFDLGRLPQDYKVIANVPYYITSKIIRLLLESPRPPRTVVLLVQKEVAERLAARPGNMSVLAISAQFYAEVSLHGVVPAALFTPPPKVDSQIVKLAYRGPRFTDIAPKAYFHVVRAGFAERRKKLRSSLSGSLHLDKKRVDQLLASLHLPPAARAQELSLQDWYELAKEIEKL